MAKVSTSTFWQLERAQTALRMRQSQARFWRPVIGVVWLLCSAVYLWVGIGTAGRGYFVVWLNASFWGWLWPRHLVAFQGRWYAPQTLAHWLQQTVVAWRSGKSPIFAQWCLTNPLREFPLSNMTPPGG